MKSLLAVAVAALAPRMIVPENGGGDRRASAAEAAELDRRARPDPLVVVVTNHGERPISVPGATSDGAMLQPQASTELKLLYAREFAIDVEEGKPRVAKLELENRSGVLLQVCYDDEDERPLQSGGRLSFSVKDVSTLKLVNATNPEAPPETPKPTGGTGGAGGEGGGKGQGETAQT